MDVMVKKISDEQIEIIEKIAVLQLPFCEQIILNNKRKAVTCYIDEYFYVSLYLRDLMYDKNESNRYLSNILSSLHAQTFHIEKSDIGYYENYLLFFKESLNYKREFDNQVFINVISDTYKSPTQWVYIKFNELGVEYLNAYAFAITAFEKLTFNKTNIRKVINFNHFTKDSLDYSKKLLIGLHKTKDNSPVFDLLAWIQSCNEDTMLENLRQYSVYFVLQDYEKFFLLCLLYDAIKFDLSSDEFNNIKILIKMRDSLRFINSLNEIMGLKQINIDNL